jgi:nucleotidyltransferase substrate binding protein (TIGR01987 family)
LERLRQRLALAEQALRSFQELASLERPSAVERDAAIQRFEYTFEAVWKACQRFLVVEEGLDTGSPKSCIRAAGQSGLLSEEQTRDALEMTDDRNLTAHTYNEALAKAILGRLPRHVATLGGWLRSIQQRVAKS